MKYRVDKSRREEAELSTLKKDNIKLKAINKKLLGALEKLARLGNGENYGNSDGNIIAQEAIAAV